MASSPLALCEKLRGEGRVDVDGAHDVAHRLCLALHHHLEVAARMSRVEIAQVLEPPLREIVGNGCLDVDRRGHGTLTLVGALQCVGSLPMSGALCMSGSLHRRRREPGADPQCPGPLQRDAQPYWCSHDPWLSPDTLA